MRNVILAMLLITAASLNEVYGQAPLIASFTPASAKPGDVVTLTGANFSSVAANNVVFFGATRATVTAASSNSVTVIVPVSATYAPIKLLNTETTLSCASLSNFNPVYSPFKNGFTISDLDPAIVFPVSSVSNLTSNVVNNTIAVSDLDGDGKPDVVVANYNENTVSVLRNAATTGTISNTSFGPKINFATNSRPIRVAIGDIDGDGKPDLLVTNQSSNNISIFRNTSSGIGNISFDTKIDIATGSNPNGITISDLDGDGKPDLAVICSISNILSIFRNTSNGIGTISFDSSIDFPLSSSAVSITNGDMDGDGKPDLAVVIGAVSYKLSVFRNSSTGAGMISFDPKVDFNTNTSIPFFIAIGDLDGDGKPELAISNSTSASVFRNTSTGAGNISYAPKIDFATAASGGRSLAIGDLDGDGKPDLVVSSIVSSVNSSIFRNSSTGIGDINFTPSNFVTIKQPYAVAIADIDGDNKPDLVTANINGTGTIATGITSETTVSVLRNSDPPNPSITSFSPSSGCANSTTVVITGTNFTGATAVSIGGTAVNSFTVNSSTQITATVGNGTSGTIAITTPSGTGTSNETFTINNCPPTITSFSSTSAKPGDVVTLTGSNFNTIAGNNVVFFGATRAIVTTASSNSVTVIVPVGATYAPITLLNSGTLLACASLSNFNPVYSPAKIGFTSIDLEPKLDFATGLTPYCVAIGDFDQDGKSDLVVGNSSLSNISVIRNTSSIGTISFATKLDFASGYGPKYLAISDLDGDGKLDLVTANVNSNTISIFRNTSSNGNINFADKIDIICNEIPWGITISDLDGDGKPDLAVTNVGSNTVSLFRNTGVGNSITFAEKLDLVTGLNPRMVNIKDLDSDGKPDLVVTNESSNTISIFHNNGSIGTLNFSNKIDFVTGSLPYDIVVGDLDGDEKLDVAVTNRGSSTISLFRNISSIGNISFDYKIDFVTGPVPHGISIGDLDGDDKPDLAVANENSDNVSVFRNKTDNGSFTINSFSPKIDFSVGFRSVPYGVAIGDLDGDQKPDLAVANVNSNNVSVFRNSDFTIPSITSFTPSSGCANSSTVVITGTNFTGTTAVSIGGTAVNSFTVNSSTQITAIVGNGTTGTVAVTTPSGSGTSSETFVVNNCVPAITYFTPSSGYQELTSVTIIGTKFTGTSSVTIGNTPVNSFKVNSDNKITAIVGSGTTGTISVTTNFGTATSNNIFTFNNSSNQLCWKQICAGGLYTLAIKTDGTLWAWGENVYGQLGDGTIINKNRPVKIGSDNDWASVSAGSLYSLAIKTNGTLWAWGYNISGQLGDGTTISKNSPIQIGTATDWASVSAGYLHSLAIKTNGTLWAWGYNYDGQLGDGSNINKNSPVQIGTATDWSSISAGTHHSLAIKTDGTLWAWGYNFNGQLGDGTNISNNSPIQIGTATTWAGISAGELYSIGLRNNGTLWTWGDNEYGQLGDGTNNSKNSPGQVGTSTDWVSVSAAFRHTLALKINGSLWAWGRNIIYELGDGTNINRYSPVQIGSNVDWAIISGGSGHSVSIKTDATIWDWGYNGQGQLGDGTNTDKVIPAPITCPSNAPSIISFTPSSGCVNNSSTVVITGTNFTGTTAISISGTPVSSFTVNSSSQITAIVGNGTTGAISVTTPDGTATSADAFIINAAPVFTPCSQNLSKPADAGACSTQLNYTVAATGNPAPTLSYVFTGVTSGNGSGTGSGASFNLGITNVTITATNSCGSSTCSFTITVTDNTAPTIICPSNITNPVASTDPSQTGWARATDNCTVNASIILSYTDNTQGCVLNRIWKATDATGNYTTCVQTIAIPQMSVSLGPNMYILYGALGYIGCKTLNPVITGGVAPFTYLWTSTQPSVNNATTSSIYVCNTTEIVYTYTVKVTSANGCVATATVVLNFIDISCSNNNNNVKVSVCLRPQGNTSNCNTICVSQNAAPGLVSNGSYYGKCLPGCEVPIQGRIVNTQSTIVIGGNEPPKQINNNQIVTGSEISVRIFNNPTETSFQLIVYSQSNEKIAVRIFDVTGRTIENFRNHSVRSVLDLGKWYINGVYFAEITQGKNRKVVKLIKQ
jgi:alpha-tubulin suppressor-like RCC1 family protein/6-phosphogluconolactonase (cycloisomerase 2 family)